MNETTWLQNGPVSENGHWRILMFDGFDYRHFGRWELNGGALTLISEDGGVLSAFGQGHWRWVRQGES